MPGSPRLRGRVQISLLRARHRVSYIAGALGFAGTVVLLAVDPPTGLKAPVLVATLLVTAQGLLSFAADAAGVWREGRRLYLARVDRGQQIDALDLGDACHEWHRGEFGGRRYAYDRAVNRQLQRTPVPVELRPGSFSVPGFVAPHAAAIIASKFQGGVALFDSTVLRLATDPCVDEWPVQVQASRYFAGECTNETVGLDVRRHVPGAASEDVLSGARLLQDNGVIYDIAHSPCANIIGISTLAFTSDLQLVVVHQSRESAQSANQLAPSGSGSAEPVDRHPGDTLQDLVARAMERELREECNVPAGSGAVRTMVLGYARDLGRGGKPEFFGLSRLGTRFDALRTSRRERAFVAAIDPATVKLRSASSLLESLRRFRAARQPHFSLALHLNLCLLEQAIEDDWEHVARFLRE